MATNQRTARRAAARASTTGPDAKGEQQAPAVRPRARRARSPAKTAEAVRAGIDAERIMEKLTAFVLGEAELTSLQVTAALGLLKKSLPDLQTATAEPAGPLIIEVVKLTDAARPDPE